MTDDRKEPRGQQTQLDEAEVAALIAERKAREAAAEQADEREMIKTIAMGGIVLSGLVVAVVALLFQENVVVGIIGFVAAAVGGAVITASEGLKFLGRDK